VPTVHLVIACVTIITLALIAASAYSDRIQALKVQVADARHMLARAEGDRDEALAVAAHAAALAPVVGATVGVHLPGGEMVRGELAGGDASVIVLDKAELVAGGSVQPLGGRQHLARSHWTQEL